jgi:trk system potassium uptake protein
MTEQHQQIAVIGLGRFGTAVAVGLAEAGHEVLGIDSNMDAVERVAPLVSHAVQADATEEEALRRLGLPEFDAAIVSIAEHLESSVLATMLAKRLGVPRVVAKAGSELHGEILKRVGADQVVFPERDTGQRIASSWASRNIQDTLELIEGYDVHRVVAPRHFVGHSVDELDTHARFGVHLFIMARGDAVTVFPGPEESIATGDVLLLAGRSDDLARALRGDPRH